MEMNLRYRVDDCCQINIPTFSDERGTISVMDKELPFSVKRIFWLYKIFEGKERGAHALLNGFEVMVAVHGSLIVELDDAIGKKNIILNDPSIGIIVRPGIWFRTHSYSKQAVLLVISSEEYSRERYTYDYEEFKRMRSIG